MIPTRLQTKVPMILGTSKAPKTIGNVFAYENATDSILIIKNQFRGIPIIRGIPV
jgi:hypothetical protein